MQISETVKRESVWLMGSSVFLKILHFVTIIVLSRILQPDDFGLFGLAYSISEILAIIGNFGIGTYLVYKTELDSQTLSTAIKANLVLGIVLTILTIIFAPFIAGIFEQPFIETIMYVFSGHLLFTITGNIHLSLLQKRMAFKLIAKINTFVLIGGSLLTILMAVAGFGIWSFIVPTVMNSFILTAFYWSGTKAKPTDRFSLAVFKEMAGYSKFVWIGDVNSILLHNIGLLLIAKYLTMEILGYFKFSLSLVMAVVVLFNEANARIFMPLFAHIKKDAKALADMVVKLVQYLSVLSVPLFILLFQISENMIITVFGLKWKPAIEPFKAFCLFGIFAVVSRVIPSLLNATGRPQLRSIYSAIFIPVTVILILLLMPYSTLGVSLAYALSHSLYIILIFIHSMFLIKIPLIVLIKKTSLLFFPTVIMVLFIYLVQQASFLWNSLAFIVIQVMVGLILFVAVFRIQSRRAFNELYLPIRNLRG